MVIESFQPFYIFYSGNVDDDLSFEYGVGTDVNGGCGATLMGEMWYFGGYYAQTQVCFLETVLIIEQRLHFTVSSLKIKKK